MNLSKYTAPWMASLLLAATSAFSQDNSSAQTAKPKCKSFEQGRRLVYNQMMPGYNATARTEVRGAWDLFVTGSFIYWQFSQDNMEVAFVDALSNSQYTSNRIQGNYVPMDFNYIPGFQVGLGINFDLDNWDSYGEYTRIHGSNSKSTNGITAPDNTLAPILATWGNAAIQGSNAYNNVSEHWDCHLDIADIDVGRTYYVGTSWTVRPAFGARAAWILQKLHVNHTNTSFVNPAAPIEIPGELNVHHRSHSWAIGPRAALKTNWMVGSGFRFFGETSADILYTKYEIESESVFVATQPQPPILAGNVESFSSKNHVSTVRPHMDMEIGLGWGSYFDNNNWHIDLSASYGFQVFFNQNMFPRSEQTNAPAKQQLGAGNLYAQGATGTVRFDF